MMDRFMQVSSAIFLKRNLLAGCSLGRKGVMAS